MADKQNELPYPQAGLGVVSTTEGLKSADGTQLREGSRGCPACNRQEGRASASLALVGQLLLEPRTGEETDGRRRAVHVTIDYCPSCGRVYDVRCAANKQD